MGCRVIQGFFIGGAMRPQPAAAQAGRRQAAGAPPRAFAGRAAPALQARMAPERPSLAHQGAGAVAQAHGGDGSFAIDPVRLGLARGGGKPLPEAVRAKMEAAFGADFSAVRVHVGPQASRIGAVAFTTGNDLYFAPGQYQPESVQGQQLLGHELAHVIQQREGRVRSPGNGIAVVQDRMLEAEADRLGMRAAAHRPPLQAKMAESARGEAQVHISAHGGTSPGSYRLTAGPGASPVGSLVVHTRRGAAAEVTDLGVAPGHRDRGIGRQLLVSAARAGLRSGNSKLSLSAQDNGTGRLTRWYKDLGFQQVGVNGRGMPVLEAPISRLLAGPVQAKAHSAQAGRSPIQRAAAIVPDKFAGIPYLYHAAPKKWVATIQQEGLKPFSGTDDKYLCMSAKESGATTLGRAASDVVFRVSTKLLNPDLWEKAGRGEAEWRGKEAIAPQNLDQRPFLKKVWQKTV
jgi:ribosomal protein S18 acetylase RimI-like enzyme